MVQSANGKLPATFLSLCAMVAGGLTGGGCVQTAEDPGMSAEEIHSRRPMPVIFDNDADFDDLATLAYLAGLHKAGRIRLKLVSITHTGAGLPGAAIRHTRCLMQRFGITDVPVADSALQGTNAFPGFLRNSVDVILSDLDRGCTESTAPSAIPAEVAIANVLRDSREPVALVVTGPVTNVAAALDQDDDDDCDHRNGHGRGHNHHSHGHGRSLVTKIRHMWVMGGAIGIPGGLCCGLTQTFDNTQTFNMWADPDAVQTLLDVTLPLQMSFVGYNATQYVPIRQSFVDRLATEGTTTEARYVSDMVHHPIVTAAIQAGLLANWWDPLTEIASSTPGVVTFEMRHIKILQTGASQGRTEVVPNDDRDGTWVRFATNADQIGFENAFMGGLNGNP